ncbi:MAG: GDSL-type esterase/lipase family protein [Bariatricus sp.]
MRIDADNKKLQYSGRIDWSHPKEPVFVYPCTSVRMKFTGNVLKIHVRNQNAYWNNFLGCILDGEQISLLLPQEGETVLDIPVKRAGDHSHEVLFFKRQDACHELTILGMEIEEEGQILDLPAKPKRRIEVYGDSVSAGELSEAVNDIGREDPEHNGEYSNSWYSYAWMLARKLNAQIHDIAQGGIALMDQTGWFCEPDAIGMESMWDKIRYNPLFGKTLEWNFAEYVPQVVIVAIGQNDSHPQDYMKEDRDGVQAETWRTCYRQFLDKIRQQYPDSQIICCTTLMEHDEAWDASIGQVVKQMEDERVSQYLYSRNGKGTPGHLRIPEAQEMAEELAAYIETLKIEGWEG